jgi:hypothetical protein
MPWTEQSRAAEAARIRQHKPWLKSTGPRTASGKAITSRNAYKGGWEPKLRSFAATLRKFECASQLAPLDSDQMPPVVANLKHR